MNENDSKNGQVDEIEAGAEAFPLYVNEWGSCQYTFAYETYIQLCKLEEEHTRDAILEKLGVGVGKVQPLEGEVLTSFKESHCEDLAAWEEDGEDVTWLRTKLEGVKTVTEALHFLRDWSWDLWSAAPYMAASVFPELNLDSIPDAPGVGPPLNALAQDNNNRIGLICWLFRSYGFVEDDEPFKEWDT